MSDFIELHNYETNVKIFLQQHLSSFFRFIRFAIVLEGFMGFRNS